MPKRQRDNERAERRVVRRRNRTTARASIVGIPRSLYSLPLTGFANSKMVKLRYAEEFQLNPGVGSLASYVFRANDLYDPTVAVGGHQPSGFDQNMLFYDHFTVIASKITVRFIPATTSNVIPAYFDVILTDNGTTASTFTSANDFIESRFATGDRMTQAGTERNYFGLDTYRVKTFSAKKFFRKTNVVGDSLYRGDVTQSPTEQAYYEVIAHSIAANDPGALNFLAVIDYIAVLTEPKNVAQS